MIEVARLKPENIYGIEKHKASKHIELLSKEDAETLCNLPDSYALFSETGRLIGIGGVVPRWPGRGEGWILLAPKVREHLDEIAKIANAILSKCEINRIEIAVACGFEAGHIWAEKLWFRKEADCLESYDEKGNDCAMYARVKNSKKAGV